MPCESDLMQLSMRAPFPPPHVMLRGSGVTSEQDFASHGRELFCAFSLASARELTKFTSILDFGVGNGRLARMFHGFGGSYHGVEEDQELVDWVNDALPWVSVTRASHTDALPFPDGHFDCVIAVSALIFMNEERLRFCLSEIQRTTKGGATLLLAVYGRRAAHRARYELPIEEGLGLPLSATIRAGFALDDPDEGFFFAKKDPLDQEGIAFISEPYIRREWSKFFNIERVVPAAIHDFQDIIVAQRRGS